MMKIQTNLWQFSLLFLGMLDQVFGMGLKNQPYSLNKCIFWNLDIHPGIKFLIFKIFINLKSTKVVFII
jgi:hypothetical protein